jgi:pyridoxal phosphate enzyme (YggS family)
VINAERIRQNLELIQSRIASAVGRSGRPAGTVRLVAVTKRNSSEAIRTLVENEGARDLGENYPQELWRKVDALADLSAAVRWHLIGHLQSNKAKKTLPLVTMIHSVDSLSLLQSLDKLVSGMEHPPAVCLQVNASGEASKHGWSAEEILNDSEAIAECRAIPIVGLMTMAALAEDAEAARPAFRGLREVRDQLRVRTGLELPELSMGMSGDFEVAIEEGATLVRVGSALFEGAET